MRIIKHLLFIQDHAHCVLWDGPQHVSYGYPELFAQDRKLWVMYFDQPLPQGIDVFRWDFVSCWLAAALQWVCHDRDGRHRLMESMWSSCTCLNNMRNRLIKIWGWKRNVARCDWLNASFQVTVAVPCELQICMRMKSLKNSRLSCHQKPVVFRCLHDRRCCV